MQTYVLWVNADCVIVAPVYNINALFLCGNLLDRVTKKTGKEILRIVKEFSDKFKREKNIKYLPADCYNDNYLAARITEIQSNDFPFDLKASYAQLSRDYYPDGMLWKLLETKEKTFDPYHYMENIKYLLDLKGMYEEALSHPFDILMTKDQLN